MKQPITSLFILFLIFSPAFSNGLDLDKDLNYLNKTAQNENSIVAVRSNGFPDTLCIPNPSPEAVALFRYLQDMAGKKILSGQMDAPWGIEEIAYVQTNTGKLPAIRGIDFIHERDNNTEVQNAINWWNAGGIPTIMWHWARPAVGEGYENSKVAIDIAKCFQVGSPEYISMWSELKIKADHLETLRDANIPIIWRPFHELNGNWFWWGKQGPELFKQLWRTMFNYFVNERKLNNLIWVLCYTGDPNGAWNPGEKYFDIGGADTYGVGSDAQKEMFNKVVGIVGNNKEPIAYHECGVPPNPDDCLSLGAMWSWWMEWHTDLLSAVNKDYLRYLYNHELIITRDELPNIVATYSWNKNCSPSSIISKLKIDGGALQDTNNVLINTGTSILLSPETVGAGTWAWSGCGISGTNREQSISGTGICTATATFLNQCGATSTATFNIMKTFQCAATGIDPYIQINGGTWTNAGQVTVNAGATIKFGPHPVSGGSWSWMGCNVSGSSRELAVNPTGTCTYRATYTNYCGAKTTYDYKVTVRGSTGIDDIINSDKPVVIYPKLCSEVLNVEIRQIMANPVSNLNLYTMDGTLVLKKTMESNKISLNVSGLNSGIYLLRFLNDDFEIVEKIVVE